MLDVLTFILCFCILLILVIAIVIFFYAYLHTKNYVISILSDISKYLPNNTEYEYSEIQFDKFNKFPKCLTDEMSEFLIYCNMATYNTYGGYDVKYPTFMHPIKTLGAGKIGQVYKVGAEGTDGTDGTEDNVYILVFRGTRTGEELINDLDSVQISFMEKHDDILVHRGFYRLWRDTILPELNELYAEHFAGRRNIKIIATGHSLGSANSLFTCLHLCRLFEKEDLTSKFYIENFASPRIGNDKFVEYLKRKLDNVITHINIPDIVPNLPPVTLSTLGSTWIYRDFDNIRQHDVQMGSVSINHRLDTYLYSISKEYSKSSGSNPLWFQPYRIIENVLL